MGDSADPAASTVGSVRRSLLQDRRIQVMLGVSLVVQIALAWHHMGQGFIDLTNEEEFFLIGKRLVDVGEFGVNERMGPFLLHGPTYPFLVAVSLKLFGSYFPLLVAQSVFSLAASVLLVSAFGACLRRAGQGETLVKRIELVTAAVLFFSPLSLLYNRLLMSEAVATGLLIMASVAWLSAQWMYETPGARFSRGLRFSLVAGVLLGIGALAKPVLLPFGGALILTNVICRRTGLWTAIRRDVLTIAVMVAVIAPWTYRNYGVGGAFIPVTGGAGAGLLYCASPPRADGAADLTPEELKLDERRLLAPAREMMEIDAVMKAKGAAKIKQDPLLWVRRSIVRSARFWVSSHGWYWEGKQLSRIPRLFWTGLSAVSALFGFGMIAFILRRRLREVYYFGMIPVYFTAVHFPTMSAGRYAAPAWPFLLCLVCFGVVLLRERVRSSEARGTRTSALPASKN
jgi:hypothetical protein